MWCGVVWCGVMWCCVVMCGRRICHGIVRSKLLFHDTLFLPMEAVVVGMSTLLSCHSGSAALLWPESVLIPQAAEPRCPQIFRDAPEVANDQMHCRDASEGSNAKRRNTLGFAWASHEY